MANNIQALELDLAQVNWPFCLLEFKNAIKDMSRGQLLTVKVSDPNVLSNMVQVLSSSPDRVLHTGELGTFYVLTVQKG